MERCFHPILLAVSHDVSLVKNVIDDNLWGHMKTFVESETDLLAQVMAAADVGLL